MPELDFAPRVLWRRGSIALDGLRLAYDLAGGGRPLVFLGGGPGDGPGYLLPLADASAQPGWRLVVLHQRGTGRSPVRPGSPLTMRQASEDLATLAGHLRADQMVLVGHSYGAALALLTAAIYPDLVAGAVLVGPGPVDAVMTARADAALRGLLDDTERASLRVAQIRRDGAAATGNWHATNAARLEVLRLAAPAYVHSPDARERWVRELAEEFDHDPCTHAALSRSLAELDQHAVARAVRCPVRVVRGSHDYVTQENAEALCGLLAHADLAVIEGAAHLPWLDRPADVAAAVRDFLAAR